MFLKLLTVLLAAFSVWTAYLWNRMKSEKGDMDIPSYIGAQFIKAVMPHTYPNVDPYSPTLWRTRLGRVRKSASYNFKGRITDLNITAADGHTPLPAKLYHPSTYTKSSGPVPSFLWIHGGGWVIGDINVDNLLAAKVADRTGMIVLSISYRMAPEHPFPAAADDVLVALRWLKENIGVYGGTADEIYVGGESSGGNLAASLVLTNLDDKYTSSESRAQVKGTLLVYPPLASYSDLPSYAKYDYLSLLSARQMEYFRELYAPTAEARRDVRYAPLLASDELLARMPPTILLIAQYDVLADDSLLFEQRLRNLKVSVVSRMYNTSTHGFFAADNFPYADEAATFACDEIVKISTALKQ
eukprot:gene29090-35110_t